MKKVLIIAYHYPPRGTIGSQRPFGLARYLPAFGWEPVVLTAKLPEKAHSGVRVIETEYNDILSAMKLKIGLNPDSGLHEQLGIKESKNYDYPTWKSKGIKLLKETIAFPDEKRGWYKYLIKAASELLDSEKVDAILSTSSPVTSHLAARRLKQIYKIPWIADLRDLWTQNHFYRKCNLIKFFDRKLEIRTLFDADVLVTVTPGFADELKSFHRDKDVLCVTNGFDAEEGRNWTPVVLTKKFTITYTGALYNGRRDPSPLFEALVTLIRENKINRTLIDVRFYGKKEEWLIEDVNRFGLQGVVNYKGCLSREEALIRQKESQLLLLLLDHNDHEKDVYPAKVFEYFSAGRPIVACGGSGGIIKNLLDEANMGDFAEDANELVNIVFAYYQEFIEFGKVSRANNSNIEKYSYNSIAEKYSLILDGIVNQ